MKILYCGLEHNYYDPAKGRTFEYANFYESLKNFPGAEVVHVPFDTIIEKGTRRWNTDLLETAGREKPDLVFCFMFTDELSFEVLGKLQKQAPVLAWFADDSWRFWNYSRRYAPRVSWAVTTYSWMPEAYRSAGQPNTLRSQWACNHILWKPVPSPEKDIDVSFIGQRTSARARLVDMLKRVGIKIYVRGLGWPEGRVSHEEMCRLVGRSKINLNLNAPPSLFAPRNLARLFLRRSKNRLVPDAHLIQNVQSWWHMRLPQVKARAFELAGCDAFTISGFGDDLNAFYTEGKEMEFYRSERELIEKIRTYLPRETERLEIARAGLTRTLREHTYEKRFERIFRSVLP